jgi:radical SAM protein with 4Fe4S-binding SPASM domain
MTILVTFTYGYLFLPEECPVVSEKHTENVPQEVTMTDSVTSCLAPSFLPATAVLEMTYRCNHECLFCSCPWYSPRGDYAVKSELSIEEWKGIIRKLCTMGVSSLAFTGGEPLLKEGIEELIAFSSQCRSDHIETVDGVLVRQEKPPELHLLSNGKIMSDRILELCREYGVHLGMSLPGLTSFREHTRRSDAEPVVQWFRRAHELGISTHAGITVTRKNLHELYETIAESLLAGADSVLLNRFMPGGRGLTYAKELMLTKAELVEMLDIAEDVLNTAHRQGNLGTEVPLCLIDKSRYSHLKVGTQCSAAIDFFAIDPSGYMRVCNHSPVRICHVSEPDRARDHPYWRRFALKNYLPSACSGCADIGCCDGGCREAAHIWRGAPDGPDPLMDDN